MPRWPRLSLWTVTRLCPLTRARTRVFHGGNMYAGWAKRSVDPAPHRDCWVDSWKWYMLGHSAPLALGACFARAQIRIRQLASWAGGSFHVGGRL
eukprot:1329436-Alexandrium_andersonii.AAC.1